ncbi:DUF898 family protein [Salinarimonas soli]|uniref:DUF898 domain-containing protein n=1 Tax=Salinarimonas soli TaxID=1638099 RepID=A0A5B2V3F1_9HYPH|nr:DUF898 family protein [Salinarimonas soli]KAA2233160.1 DUF898 domain-containing protein [Salinarimonas soli]
MPAVPPPIDAAAAFRNERGAFFRILIRGALLQLPTFGFYRFWLLTEMRRHLWSRTSLGGVPFAYTGQPRELLVGFLVATALLVPAYVAYAIVGLVAEAWQAFASVPLFLVFWFFGHFALYRARAYKVSRTQFRGLRFWMDGSGLAYAVRAILWDVAVVASLGLAYPWRAASLERYKMAHTSFGTLKGGFTGTGANLFRRGAVYWLVGLAAVGLAAALAFATAEQPSAALPAGAGVAVLAAMVLYPLLMGVHLRWQVEGTRFGALRFESRLTAGGVFWIYLKAALIIQGFLIAAGIVLGITVAVLGDTPKDQFTPGLVLGFAVIALVYLAMLLGFGVLKRFYVDRGVWQAVADTTTASGVGVLDTAAAAGAPAGSVGAGLADALDLSGGL